MRLRVAQTDGRCLHLQEGAKQCILNFGPVLLL